MSSDNLHYLVSSELSVLQRHYPGWTLSKCQDGVYIIKNSLFFSAIYDDVSIEDKYCVEIKISPEYPKTPPTGQETGGRISSNFHLHKDNTLCLGSPIAIKTKFDKDPTLLGFVENLLIPYLYSHSYKEKYGKMPFDELSHGMKGIFEYYKELFDIDCEYAVLRFLKILADNNYRGHLICPCGSDIKLRDCHGKQILKIIGYEYQVQFELESYSLIDYMIKRNREIPKSMYPQKLLKMINKSRKIK